jgi:transposase-like protein
MITCPHCQRSGDQVKSGLTQADSQRYLGKVCWWRYTPEPKPSGYEVSIRRQAVRLYGDGNNQSRIARQMGISQGSESNWVQTFADSPPDERPQPDVSVAVAKIDVLFTVIAQETTSIS